MFAAPPVIDTEVFAELPASLRVSNRKSKWVEFRKKGQPRERVPGLPGQRNTGESYATGSAPMLSRKARTAAS